MSEERDARLILASLATPRFPGRARLLKLAEKGDDTALDALEMTPREQKIALLRGAFSPKVTSFFSSCRSGRRDCFPTLRRAYEEAEEKRHKRKLGIPQGWVSASARSWRWVREDPLKERKPGQSLERFMLEIFEKSLRRAGFRHASGGSKTVTTFVPAGQAAVKVEHGSVRKQGSGWWRLTVTRHWRVSPEILKVPQARDDGSRWDGKYLWLAPDIRVRQGRGVDLVVERRRGGKWEISKPSGEYIEGSGWKANWR